MKAVVIGAGQVGFEVAKMLSQEDHDVIVIDVNQEALERVSEKLDVMTIQGTGTSARVLDAAGVKNAEILVAVTTVDEVNIIACMLADKMGVETTVARVRSDELSDSDSVLQAADLGIKQIIHPEDSAAKEIAQLLRRASATDVLEMADGRLHLVGIRLERDAPLIGKTIMKVQAENPDLKFRIAAISRGIRTFLPRGQDVFHRDDQVFVLTYPKSIPLVIEMMGKTDRKIENVMILGGSEIGERLATQLSANKHMHIKLVEADRQRAERIAEKLKNVLVINSAATDIDVLITEGLSDMDAFVAVTDDEESNLVICLLAKHLQVRKTVALLSQSAYIPISRSIGLDAAVNKKLAISREIMRFLRGRHVLSVATVNGMDAEILEIEAQPRSPVSLKRIKDLNLPKGILIGAVMHGHDIEIATGDTRIEPGSRSFVFVLRDAINEAERLFSKP
ncbi:MAG: Trk system potassium transporter TrkA [Bacteroidetes bacterium]|nr:MAG: Trk system potassium transporter TrkA [Bacteroidota bacterium]